MSHCYGDGENRKTMSVVRCAVEGIDDPEIILRSADIQVFLRQDPVSRIFAEDFLLDEILGEPVHFSDEVHVPFVFYSKLGREAILQKLSREAGNADSVFEELFTAGLLLNLLSQCY
jgi:hypothetical protein